MTYLKNWILYQNHFFFEASLKKLEWWALFRLKIGIQRSSYEISFSVPVFWVLLLCFLHREWAGLPLPDLQHCCPREGPGSHPNAILRFLAILGFLKSAMSDYARKITLSVYIYQYFLQSLSFINNTSFSTGLDAVLLFRCRFIRAMITAFTFTFPFLLG